MNPEIEKKAEECKQAIIEELQNKNIDKYDGKMGYQIQIMYAESTPIVKVMDIHLQFVIELKLITRQPHQKTFCKIFDESDFIENTLGFDNAFYKLRQLINQYKIGIKQKDSVIISESKTPEIDIMQDRKDKIKKQFKYEQDKVTIEYNNQKKKFIVTLINEIKKIQTECIIIESDFIITEPSHYFSNNPWMVKLGKFKSEHAMKIVQSQNISIQMHPMDISQIYNLLNKIKQRNEIIDTLNQENKEIAIRIETFLMTFIQKTDEKMPEWIGKMIGTYQEKLQIVNKNKSRDMGDY